MVLPVVKALHKVPIKTEESIRASAKLLGDIVNMLVNFEYIKQKNSSVVTTVSSEISRAVQCINDIKSKTNELDKLESTQKILALNASIEAARAGESGRGFAIVANKVGELANTSDTLNEHIKTSVNELAGIIYRLDQSQTK